MQTTVSDETKIGRGRERDEIRMEGRPGYGVVGEGHGAEDSGRWSGLHFRRGRQRAVTVLSCADSRGDAYGGRR